MPIINESWSESLLIVEELTFEVVAEFPYYGTIAEADRYFGVLLHAELWERTTPIRKYKALVSATKVIDNLRFAGRKNDSDQDLEFPRNDEEEVPLAIRQACYEEALALLRGVDPVTEYDNLFVKTRGFGPIKTDYDSSRVPEYKKHGIASLRAWHYLLPFLKPNLDLRIRRES